MPAATQNGPLVEFLETTRQLLYEIEAALLNTHQRLLHERTLGARIRCDQWVERLKQPPATN
jgi:hypothetical protein